MLSHKMFSLGLITLLTLVMGLEVEAEVVPAPPISEGSIFILKQDLTLPSDSSTFQLALEADCRCFLSYENQMRGEPLGRGSLWQVNRSKIGRKVYEQHKPEFRDTMYSRKYNGLSQSQAESHVSHFFISEWLEVELEVLKSKQKLKLRCDQGYKASEVYHLDHWNSTYKANGNWSYSDAFYTTIPVEESQALPLEKLSSFFEVISE